MYYLELMLTLENIYIYIHNIPQEVEMFFFYLIVGSIHNYYINII